MQSRARWSIGLAAVGLALLAQVGWAQRVQFAQGAAPYPGAAPVYAPPPLSNPPAITSSPYAAPPANFDPYAAGAGAAASPPSLLGPPSMAPLGAPPHVAPTWTPTPYYQPGMMAPTTSAPPFPSLQPPVMFPNGLQAPQLGYQYAQPEMGPYLKLFQNIRFQHTWLNGSDGPDDVDINDTEIATTIAFPNFLFSGQPIFISPGFVWHFWDGPGPPSPPGAPDLPARAYSAYVDFGWRPQSRFTPNLAAELGVRIGAFSDFHHFDKDSIRYQGLGLGLIRLTPQWTLKAGVAYLDRNKIKLLPAGGLLWTPDPQTRFDFFFPKPKLAKYLTTLGLTEVWWYLGGEYGGGAWSIERAGSVNDRIDLNDIRVIGGLEWTHPSQLQGFFEVGYVFERELIYVNNPADSIDLKDTFMLRAGLSY